MCKVCTGATHNPPRNESVLTVYQMDINTWFTLGRTVETAHNPPRIKTMLTVCKMDINTLFTLGSTCEKMRADRGSEGTTTTSVTIDDLPATFSVPRHAWSKHWRSALAALADQTAPTSPRTLGRLSLSRSASSWPPFQKVINDFNLTNQYKSFNFPAESSLLFEISGSKHSKQRHRPFAHVEFPKVAVVTSCILHKQGMTCSESCLNCRPNFFIDRRFTLQRRFQEMSTEEGVIASCITGQERDRYGKGDYPIERMLTKQTNRDTKKTFAAIRGRKCCDKDHPWRSAGYGTTWTTTRHLRVFFLTAHFFSLKFTSWKLLGSLRVSQCDHFRWSLMDQAASFCR